MHRIDTIRLTITTGSKGHPGPVRLRFNGIELEVARVSGGTGAGETYVGEFFVGSLAESCELIGPREKTWDVRELGLSVRLEGGETVDQVEGPFQLTPEGSAPLEIRFPHSDEFEV